MKKNVAGQKIGAQMVSATDGSAFTGAVTVYVCGDAGTQAAGSVGSGACTHEGNGYHTYAPAQAETNYDLIAFTFIGSGAVPATVQVFTSYPQTGDAFARLGAPTGASVSADVAAIKAETAQIVEDTGTDGVVVAAGSKTGYALTSTEHTNIADAILKRDWTAVTGEASRSLLNSLRFLRNKWSVSGSTLTVTKEDDATTAWTATLNTDAAADPITGSDPA